MTAGASPARAGLSGGIGGAAGIIVASILASRVLGFIRQRAINAEFGVSAEADAWYAAFRIPDTIFMLLAGGALLSAVIPVYAEVRARGDARELRRFVADLFKIVGAATIVVAAIGALLAGPLMRAIAPGFSDQTLEIATGAARWLMLSPVLLGLSAVAKAVLQSRRRFLFPAVSPVLYNFGIIFGVVVLARQFGVTGLVWGALIGAGLHLAVQLPGFHQDRGRSAGGPTVVRRSLGSALGLENPDIRSVIRLVLPRMLGVAVLQISLIYVNILASLQGESAVAAVNNAFILMLLPLGVFAMSLGEAAFPELSDRWAGRDRSTFAGQVTGVTRHVLFLNIPATVVLAVLAEPIVAVLFQDGAFDARATELTAAALRWFAVGLAGHAAVEVLVRGFFAMQDTRTPVLIGVGSLAVHMPLSWLFAQVMGHAGIALGLSIGVLIEAMVLGLVLARRDGLSLAMPVARSVAITLTATLVMGLVIAVLRVTTWSGGDVTGAAAALLIGYLAAAVASYALFAVLLGSDELSELVGRLLARFRSGPAAPRSQ